jgi:hypothetical protein
MKALFTVQPAIGHLHPLIPVAQALESAGHGVAFCSSASFRPEVERYGFEYVDAGLDWITSDLTTWKAFPPMPAPPDPAFPAFAGPSSPTSPPARWSRTSWPSPRRGGPT